jgi:predicted GNAT family acetyltransferase
VASAPALEVTRPRDPKEFEDQAGAFLAAREAENNLILGLITGLKGGRTFGPEPPFFVVVRDGAAVVGAAMRTPPLNLILAAGTADRALAPILERLEEETSEIPGMSGPKVLVGEAARLWSVRQGASARIAMAQRIYQLTALVPPKPVSGRMRVARVEERVLLATWFQGFTRESMPYHDDSLEHAGETADYWVRGGGLRIWEDNGPVSMAGAGGITPNGIRVGAVYTPPEKRRRGYASALVAALSQEQLEAGRKFCFLYTDLANPTANKIYRDIGYEPVLDVDEYAFSI